jgi:hypothetical protein
MLDVILSILVLLVFVVSVCGACLIVCDKQTEWNARHKNKGE